ncbi:hypothetical protein HS088_TW16G00035 [Tripterygium wilfordii]|uniref:Zinc finger LSD1-type domain-containing protein n=1 Tax=Tripterygium wilfordii TaxID=458696 RepID=A0A7J7CHQ5_TRIWF|nr:hypothetical protein HS088_TW16G00035 [Tripterygium wilfordii]
MWVYHTAAMQSQHVCGGCRSILLYPRGAANIICTRCNIVTSFAPPGMEMFQIICGVCRALLSYARGDTIVRCLYCHAMNLAPASLLTHSLMFLGSLHGKASNQVAHVNCRNCRMTLMYPYGAPSVKCAVCQYVTFFDRGNARIPLLANRPNVAVDSNAIPHASTVTTQSQSQTVVVENPTSVDESGRLVSNVVVGVATENKQRDSR